MSANDTKRTLLFPKLFNADEVFDKAVVSIATAIFYRTTLALPL